MRKIVIALAVIAGLIADFFIFIIKTIKNMFTAIFVLFLLASMFIIYICFATAIREKEETTYVNESGEMFVSEV